MATTPDPVAEFRATLEAAGLIPGDVAPDSVLRRCPTVDHPRSQNGWHVLHLDPPAGAYGDWSTGLSEKWSGNGGLSDEDRRRLQAEINRQRAEREAQRARAWAEAAGKARDYLAGLPPATAENPYLAKKGVVPCPDLKADGSLLVVPALSPDDNLPMSYQTILPGRQPREKDNQAGGRMKGGFFPIKGNDGPLLICEGISTGLSIHQATGGTVLCAFSAGNLVAVAKMARTRYPERKIILAADNDVKTDKPNTGVETATVAARAVGGFVAIPEALEGCKTDFNDLATARGLETVRSIIEGAEPVITTATTAKTAAATAEKWPEPIPLTPDEKAESYPADALPGVIGEAVAEVTRFVQCPVALTACSALAAVSTVAAGLVDVRRADRLNGPTGLYFLALAESGERKTTVDGFFTKEIRQWEAEQEEAHRPNLQSWRAADAAWAAERDGLVLAIKGKSKRGEPTDDLKDKLSDHETRKPERPNVPRLLVGDATSEALTWRLAKRWPVGGVLSSEAGMVFGGHAMGRDSIMRNLATFNSLWDGLSLPVDRRTSESYTVRSARLTAGLAAQPGTVRQWLENCRGLARESGFLARFLLAWPDTTQGRRMFNEGQGHWPALAQFHRRLADLLDNPVRLDDFGQLSPAALDLAPEAKDVWVNFYNEVESELRPNGDMADVRDVASKAGDNAARMAALFHCFERGPVDAIGEDHMQRAARIVTWHLYEARRFLNQIAVREAVGDAMVLEAWLIERCQAERLPALPISTLHKCAPNRLRKKGPLDAALNELEASNRIRRRREGRKIEIEVNPVIIRGDHGA